MKYTQREWDRVVGYGKVPEQYRHVSTDSADGQDKQGCEKTREAIRRTVAEKVLRTIARSCIIRMVNLEVMYKKVWGDRWEELVWQDKDRR